MDENMITTQAYWQKFSERVEAIEYFFANTALSGQVLSEVEVAYMQAMHNHSAEIEEKIHAGENLDAGKIFIADTEKNIATKLVELGFNISDIAETIEKNSPLQMSKGQAVAMLKEHLHLEDKDIIQTTRQSDEVNFTEDKVEKVKESLDWDKFRQQLLSFSQYKIDQYMENDGLDHKNIVKKENLSSIMRVAKTFKKIKTDLVTYIKNKIAQRRRMNKIRNYSKFMSTFTKFKDHLKNIFKGTESVIVLLNPKEIYKEVSKNINYEYLQAANILRDNSLGKLPLQEEVKKFASNDLAIAKNLLLKGFNKENIAQAIAMNSPMLFSKEEALNITAKAQKFLLAQKILRTPYQDLEHKTIADDFIILAKEHLKNHEWAQSDDTAIIKELLQKKYPPEKVIGVMRLSPNEIGKENAKAMVKAICLELNIPEAKEVANENNEQKGQIAKQTKNQQNDSEQENTVTSMAQNKLTNAEYSALVKYRITHPTEERMARFNKLKDFTPSNDRETLNNTYCNMMKKEINQIGGQWDKWDKNIELRVAAVLLQEKKYPVQDIMQTMMTYSPEMPSLEEARKELVPVINELKEEHKKEEQSNVIEQGAIERINEIKNFESHGKNNTPDIFYKETANLLMKKLNGDKWDQSIDTKTIGLMMLENFPKQQIISSVMENSPEFPDRQKIIDKMKTIERSPKFQQQMDRAV